MSYLEGKLSNCFQNLIFSIISSASIIFPHSSSGFLLLKARLQMRDIIFLSCPPCRVLCC